VKVAVIITGQLRDYKINALNHIKQIIEPNNADVFVYACDKNTIHTCGENVTQKYNITSVESKESITKDVESLYGDNLKAVEINENESLSDEDFGTIGYFRKRMQNQMDNIRSGFLMAQRYAHENGFKYDVIIRSRPDNSQYADVVNLSDINIEKGTIYSTQYPSGHRDPWFFSFGDPEAFDKYCSFRYLDGVDDTRTDSSFLCPEHAMERFLPTIGIRLRYIVGICEPFTGYDKTLPVKEFPYRNTEEKLLDKDGNWVPQILQN
jgi:hypothetical protein